jgi:hypothetical protein
MKFTLTGSLENIGEPLAEILIKAAHELTIISNEPNSDQAFDVSVLEGLYWYDEKKYDPISISRIYDTFSLSELEYRLMIHMPEYITSKDIEKGKEAVASTQKALATNAEFFEFNEGKCAQMLHLGPFAYEVETLREAESFVKQNHLVKNGLHHEIYLVDFTKVDSQEGLRTILREPVKSLAQKLKIPVCSQIRNLLSNESDCIRFLIDLY